MNTRPYLVSGLTAILDAVHSSLDDKNFRDLAKRTCKAALNYNENDWIYNENPNLLWGDETMFIINALKAYVEIQKECIKKIEAKCKTPLNTLTYMDSFSEQIISKLLHLQQPKEPGENNHGSRF